MSRNLYAPHGSFRRLTPNYGNAQVIAGGLRGGAPPYPVTAPVWIGPNIGSQSWTLGTAIATLDVRPLYSNTTAYTRYYMRGAWPAGIIMATNGVISGTPTGAVGSYSGLYVLAKNGAAPAAASDFFIGTVAGVNALQKTEQFDNAYWTKVASSVTANSTTDPLATATADTITEDTATGNHGVRRVLASVTLGVSYTASIYAKAGTRSVLTIDLGNNTLWGNPSHAVFDLVNGLATIADGAPGVATITDAGGGWWRCSYANVPALATSAAAQFNIYMQLVYNVLAASLSYTGDGASGLYLWGAQMEPASLANPYIAVT